MNYAGTAFIFVFANNDLKMENTSQFFFTSLVNLTRALDKDASPLVMSSIPTSHTGSFALKNINYKKK